MEAHSEFDAHESIGGRMYRRLVEGVPEAYGFVDPHGRTIFSNPRMAEILRGRISNRCYAGQSGFARVSGNIGDPKLAEGSQHPEIGSQASEPSSCSFGCRSVGDWVAGSRQRRRSSWGLPFRAYNIAHNGSVLGLDA